MNLFHLLRQSIQSLWYFTQRHREPYRTLWNLSKINLYNNNNTIYFGERKIQYIDLHAFKSMWQLQFLRNYNDFYTTNSTPLILDCGSNIGISVLRYKELYPEAKIIAFEPDPKIFQVLENNIRLNKLRNIEAFCVAVWSETGSVSFHSTVNNDSQAGRIEISPTIGSINVPAVWLGDYLQSQVDFLKLDIEGAELSILESCRHLLLNVRQMMIEVHYRVEQPEFLINIMSILRDSGFHIAVYQYLQSPDSSKPFQNNPNTNADQFPVLWAWRD